MSALNWLSEFLEKRSCQDNKPDGRPLFAYRCTIDEFNNLELLLSRAEKNVADYNLHLGYASCTEYLFTFYCAEWWRRNYSGGAWKWAPIIETLGWGYNTWNTRADFVAKGLRYWKRDLIQTGAGTQYLLSVACEGGIPINVLEREGASFKHFLKAVIREYGHYAGSGLSSEQIARDNLYRLPSSWQQDQIATLAGQIVEQMWALKSEIGDTTEPVNTLNKIRPDWNKELPFELESDQAETLVNNLLSTAREVASGDSQVLRVERNLDLEHEGWTLNAKLLLPKELHIEQIIAMGSVASAHEIPERMEMYRVIGNERILVARLSGEGQTRFVRPVPGATQSYKENADKELGLILVSRGQDITVLSVAGASELNPDLPWCFIMADEEMKHFRWVGQGGCKRREPDIFLLSNRVPKVLCNENNYGVDKVDDAVLNRMLWRIRKSAEISADQTDELYRIEPGLENVAARDYRLIGIRRYFPQTKYSLYRSIPIIQLVNDDSVQTVTNDSLFWRPVGARQWRAYDKVQMVGDIELCHRQGNIVLASWKLSIIPEHVQIQVEPILLLEGGVNIIAPNSRAATIKNVAGLNVIVEEHEEGWRFHCKRQDVLIGTISGIISWGNDRKINFSLPFPAEGASFVDAQGHDVSSSDLLTLSRLYGFRAQVVSPKKSKRYVLRGSLTAKSGLLPAIEFHKFQYPMAFDDFGVSTMPLQQLKSEIDMLFAVSTGVDDRVKLEMFELSIRRVEASVLVQQFEGVLYSDKTRRMICLATNTSQLGEEHIGHSLNLISVNNVETDALALEWNETRVGWTLPDYSDVGFDLSHTYFASVNNQNSYSIRPCVIPPEIDIDDDTLSDLAKALTIPVADRRLASIHVHLTHLVTEGKEEEWRELCAYLKRLSCVHPDGLDLVECILDFPEIMAAIWFRSVPDSTLREYLQRICDTSPFSWWMISIEQWSSALEGWLSGLRDLGDSVKNILIEECKKILRNLSDDNEEMNAVVDVLLEKLGENLSNTSVLSCVRNTPSATVWIQLDQMSRGLFIPAVDDWWPKIGDVFTLRNQLSTGIYHYIQWPANEMNYQKPVIQAPVIAAAALQQGIEINENQRVAILAARNFHPTAFATLFRATQAVLWINKDEIEV